MLPARRILTTLACYSGFVVGLMTPLPAQAIKVVDWNLLNYPSASGSTREDEFRTVLLAVHPDILVVEEVTGTTNAGMNQFLNNVLNNAFPGEYAAAPWVSGPDTNPACYYRTAKISYVSENTLTTDLRNIIEYVVRPAGYSSTAADLHLFAMHLKAGSTSSDQSQRLSEATVLRNYANAFAAGTHFVYMGDYNMQSSTEAAYQQMVGSQADNDGRAFDPLNQPGTWYNNSSFASIHTQSPMPTNSYGGATGGMDDRFDIQLVSAALQDGEGLSYVAGTYKCYGNDGQHFNLAINDAPTIPEGAAMATALAGASDHLPVLQEIQVPAKINVAASLAFGTVIVGATAGQTLPVSNSADVPGDELNYSFTAPAGFTAPGGSFSANAGAAANNHTISMSTGSAGVKSGNLTVNSNDIDNAAKTVALSGTVFNHANPSLAAAPPATSDSVDFGIHPSGGFSDQAVDVYNSGYSSLQAYLNVYGASITGPDAARFSIVGGFTPANVGLNPATWSIHFDDSGASAGSTYAATLTFTTRDQQGLPGATNLDNLTIYLKATMESQTGVPDGGGPLPMVTRLIGNRPNPFAPRTTISFDIARPGAARLEIFDVRGRLVSTLFQGSLGAGHFTLPWDGTDSRGNPVGSGVYFYHLNAPGYAATKSMTIVR